MRKAKKADWKSKPLPSTRAVISVNRTFSQTEMDQIQMGVVPYQMEDKWFIYWKDNSLFFHRSWTGFCIYVAHFTKNNTSWKMVQVEANRNPEQYKETSDERYKDMIFYLIDLLLLHKDVVFPSNVPSPIISSFMNWTQVGRAMFGQQTNDGTAKKDILKDMGKSPQ